MRKGIARLVVAVGTTVSVAATASFAVGEGLGVPPSLATGLPARWALVASSTSASISVYSIEANGALTRRSTAAADPRPGPIAVHPNRRFVYVGSSTVQTFAFDATAGVLAPLASRNVLGLPDTAHSSHSVAMEPRGRFLYVPDTSTRSIHAFAIDPDTGDLSALPGSPIAMTLPPSAIAFDPEGRFAFVSHAVDGSVSVYQVQPTGDLSAVGAPIKTLGHPQGMSVHPSGRYLYVAHGDGANVSAWTIGNDGALAPIDGSPFRVGLDPYYTAVGADGQTLYVSDPLLERVYIRHIDTWTGALSELTPPSRIDAGNNVGPLRVDPAGRFVYVAASAPSDVWAYAIDATGGLAPVAGAPFAMDASASGLALVP
jgi:6-phosphogluconolactonase (cycloisomerase 2 family)